MQINFNMGCIETKSIEPQKYYILRLTLTWDVLKLRNFLLCHARRLGLTLTWDVLKQSLTLQSNAAAMD